MSEPACRAYYRRVRARSEADSPQQFDAAVRDYLAKHPLANDADALARARAWVSAAREVRFRCRRCAGTGRFITYVENGVPRGPGGDCFRCNGKGLQNDHDVRRNEEHDKHYAGRAA